MKDFLYYITWQVSTLVSVFSSLSGSLYIFSHVEAAAVALTNHCWHPGLK